MPRKTDSQDVTNALIAQKLEALQISVADGFRIMHEKQDKTNGKVLKAAEDITSLQKEDIRLDSKFKYNKVIWYSLTVAISAIVALMSYILFR